MHTDRLPARDIDRKMCRADLFSECDLVCHEAKRLYPTHPASEGLEIQLIGNYERKAKTVIETALDEPAMLCSS
jgi:hypothetical protein